MAKSPTKTKGAVSGNVSWDNLKKLIRFLHPIDESLDTQEAPEPEIDFDIDLVVRRANSEAALQRELEYCPAARYLQSLTSQASRRAQAAQLRKIAHIVGGWDWHAVDWAAVREAEFSSILSILRDREKSAASFNSARAAFRGVVRTGRLMGLIDEAVCSRCMDLVRPRKKEKRSAAGRYVKIDEQLRAVDHIRSTSSKATVERNIAIIRLALDLGLRRGELVGINLKDLNFSDPSVDVHGKGGLERNLPLLPETVNALRAWLERRGNWPGPLFCRIHKSGKLSREAISPQSVYKLIVDASRMLDTRFSPHDCRRTFITDAIEATGGDLSIAKDLAGHASVDTTTIYDRRDKKIKHRAMGDLSDYRKRQSGGKG